MNNQRRSMWREQREGELRMRRAAVRPPIAASVPEVLDVKAIRRAIPRQNWWPITQEQFAQRFGFSPGAVRDWEQGRRKPDGAARMLLFLIRHDAAGVEAAIRSAITGQSRSVPKIEHGTEPG